MHQVWNLIFILIEQNFKTNEEVSLDENLAKSIPQLVICLTYSTGVKIRFKILCELLQSVSKHSKYL